jgi:hypothetical protein
MSVVYCGGAENPPDAGARNTAAAVLENPGVVSNVMVSLYFYTLTLIVCGSNTQCCVSGMFIPDPES